MFKLVTSTEKTSTPLGISNTHLFIPNKYFFCLFPIENEEADTLTYPPIQSMIIRLFKEK